MNPVSALVVSIALDALPVPDLVRLYYSQCEPKAAYVLTAEAQAAQVSTVYVPPGTCEDVRQVMHTALDAAGLAVSVVGTVHRIGPKSEASLSTVVYHPRHRDPAQLRELAQVIAQEGKLSVAGTDDSASSLVYRGPEAEAAVMRAVLADLDRPTAQVQVEVALYEVSTTRGEGSAIAAVADVLDGAIKVELGATAFPDRLEVSTGGLSAVLSILDQDARFRHVARPRITVADGGEARFFSGEERRVAGSVSLDAQGNPVQAVESLSAGVTLEVRPRVFAESVQLELSQEVSSFTGTGDSPVTLAREVSTSFAAVPGRVYVIAGSDTDQSGAQDSRLWRWRVGRQSQRSTSQLVMVLSVRAADAAGEGPPSGGVPG